MRAFLAFFVLSHASASGACGDSSLVAKVALVRAPIEPRFGLHLSIMPPKGKKARLGRTPKGTKSKEGALQPSQRDVRDLYSPSRGGTSLALLALLYSYGGTSLALLALLYSYGGTSLALLAAGPGSRAPLYCIGHIGLGR
jgi:hypothetical protein